MVKQLLSIGTHVIAFFLGVYCAATAYGFLDFSPPDESLESINQASEEFMETCDSFKICSSLASFLIETSDSVVGDFCEAGKCEVQVQGGTGRFYDVCVLDYEESSGEVTGTFWVNGAQ